MLGWQPVTDPLKKRAQYYSCHIFGVLNATSVAVNGVNGNVTTIIMTRPVITGSYTRRILTIAKLLILLDY
jgi:hypothetical protein